MKLNGVLLNIVVAAVLAAVTAAATSYLVLAVCDQGLTKSTHQIVILNAFGWSLIVQSHPHLLPELGRGGRIKVGLVVDAQPLCPAGELLVDPVGTLRE